MKKKRKISTKKIILGAVIASSSFLLLLLSYSFFSDNNHLGSDDLRFEHIGDEEYLIFNIKNPTNEEKLCSFRIKTTITEYKSKNTIIIPQKSEKILKFKVDFPYGKSEFNLTYTCK